MSATIRYTREVGRKFEPDGSPRLFPGNTIICMLDPASPIAQAATALQGTVGGLPFGAKFALLPLSSFHMTVMELLCDQVRQPERWSARLALDAPLAATDAFFLEQVPPVPAPGGLLMRVTGLYRRVGLMLTLAPADEATGQALRDYRAAIAEATGVRFPDHDSYGFHITLAYRLAELDAAEQAELDALGAAWEPRLRHAGAAIALGAPELRFFDDMFRFVTAAERPRLRSRAG